MNKQQMISEFDSVKELAELIGVTVQAIYMWPETLSPRIAQRVQWALMKKKKRTPKRKGEQA